MARLAAIAAMQLRVIAMKNIPADAVRHHRFPDALQTGSRWGGAAALELFGVRLTDAAPEEIADHIVRSALNGFSRTINFLNAHCVNVLRTDRTYAASLRGSDMVLPDGIGVELARGLAKPHNLNGTDLPADLRRRREQGAGIFLLGGRPEWRTERRPGPARSGLRCASAAHRTAFSISRKRTR